MPLLSQLCEASGLAGNALGGELAGATNGGATNGDAGVKKKPGFFGKLLRGAKETGSKKETMTSTFGDDSGTITLPLTAFNTC